MTRSSATWWLAATLALGACRSQGATNPTPAQDVPATEATETLSVGDVAPPFSLTDQNGQAVTLAQFTQKGTTVLVFYRGHW